MKTLSETDALNELIHFTQKQKDYEFTLLKNQFHEVYDSLKPGNIIKNVLNDLTTPNDIKDDILSNAIGLGTGILSKKWLTGSSDNPFRKVMGTVAEFAVAILVTKYTGGISTFAGNLLNNFLNKKKT